MMLSWSGIRMQTIINKVKASLFQKQRDRLLKFLRSYSLMGLFVNGKTYDAMIVFGVLLSLIMRWLDQESGRHLARHRWLLQKDIAQISRCVCFDLFFDTYNRPCACETLPLLWSSSFYLAPRKIEKRLVFACLYLSPHFPWYNILHWVIAIASGGGFALCKPVLIIKISTHIAVGGDEALSAHLRCLVDEQGSQWEPVVIYISLTSIPLLPPCSVFSLISYLIEILKSMRKIIASDILATKKLS